MPRRRKLAAQMASALATAAVVVALALALALPVLAQSHEVAVVDNGYDPAELTVFTGEPVTWTNTGTNPHTVNSDEGDELDSGRIASGETYGKVFGTPGRYAYFCEIHGRSMAGVVIVLEAPTTSPAGPPTDRPETLAPTSPEPTATPGAGGSGVGGGTVMTVVIGGLALAVAVALAVWLWLRRRHP